MNLQEDKKRLLNLFVEIDTRAAEIRTIISSYPDETPVFTDADSVLTDIETLLKRLKGFVKNEGDKNHGGRRPIK